VERRQDEKLDWRNLVVSNKASQDRHQVIPAKAVPIPRRAQPSEYRLDIVEPNDMSRRRSVGRPATRKAGHAGLNPPLIEDFELAGKVWH
jgi:hypothetical protein